MSTYPVKPRAAFLEWTRVHAPIFFDNHDKIGLRKDQAEALNAAVGAAAAAQLAREAARQAALVAAREARQAFATLALRTGDAVRSIRAFAAASPEADAVYSLAQIPPTAGPSPVPPPGRPSDLSVTLDPSAGSVSLRWKARNPENARGTSYIVRRKLPGEAEFSFVGVAGKKRFVDQTLMFGAGARDPVTPAASRAGGILAPAAVVQYTVQGQRADVTGPVSPIFTVNFGKLPGKNATMVTTAPAQPAAADAWNTDTPAPKGNGRTNRREQPALNS